ncbi:MAG TPA: hypothetical protein VMV62_00300, partial [Candidatus Paceibacterota bacterium]|nr:hypothetical protein [Candidatus Paceibacterota bacterium]
MMKITRSLFIASVLFLAMPDVTFAAQQLYSTPGTYYFTVPTGVTSITAYVIGGGGGGGAEAGWGDSNAGGGGGSGGFYTISGPVNGGAVITVVVGAGGTRATWTYNGNYMYPCNQAGTTSGNENGNPGGTSSISANGSTIASVTGGQGGRGAITDIAGSG